MRSALLVAAVGAFVALSTAPSSAADGEPTGTTTSQSDTSATSAESTETTDTQESEQSGEAEQSPSPEPEPAVEDEPQPEPEPESEPESEPDSQTAPAEEPAQAQEPAPAEGEPTQSAPAPQEYSTTPEETADEGGQTPSGSGTQHESEASETPVQTEDSGSSGALERLVRSTARRAGATDAVEAAGSTVQRSSARVTDLVEDGALPGLADVGPVTDPLRSLVEHRLADGLPLPGPGDFAREHLSPAVEPPGRTRAARADRLPTRDVVRRNDLLPAGAGGSGSMPQIDWTSALDARSGDSDADAPREGPASPDPTPGPLGDVLATSTSGASGFDLATFTRLVGEVVVRASALALDSRNEGVLLADPAGHPGFSPD